MLAMEVPSQWTTLPSKAITGHWPILVLFIRDGPRIVRVQPESMSPNNLLPLTKILTIGIIAPCSRNGILPPQRPLFVSLFLAQTGYVAFLAAPIAHDASRLGWLPPLGMDLRSSPGHKPKFVSRLFTTLHREESPGHIECL
ncbi:Hypothetical protein FKW44_015144 [Caligus rogercresseyi]|uniref:Uncharacterized protein n=1 Tax=Caligus rogercresseyi TaxID=217165 RepID=A0A7T8K0Z2_CALRO|nr:Hypothetical protein FKW44_015144 [Caligus rogercresseyi]